MVVGNTTDQEQLRGKEENRSLVEHCTGIAEVRVRVLFSSDLNFLDLSRCYVSSTKRCLHALFFPRFE